MTTASPELPDDIETLKAMVLAARAVTAHQRDLAARLEAERLFLEAEAARLAAANPPPMPASSGSLLS